MPPTKNDITNDVYSILEPLVGPFMAKSILAANGKRNGFTEETLSYTQLPKLAEDMKRGLATFIGNEAAEKVAASILNIRNFR